MRIGPIYRQQIFAETLWGIHYFLTIWWMWFCILSHTHLIIKFYLWHSLVFDEKFSNVFFFIIKSISKFNMNSFHQTKKVSTKICLMIMNLATFNQFFFFFSWRIHSRFLFITQTVSLIGTFWHRNHSKQCLSSIRIIRVAQLFFRGIIKFV